MCVCVVIHGKLLSWTKVSVSAAAQCSPRSRCAGERRVLQHLRNDLGALVGGNPHKAMNAGPAPERQEMAKGSATSAQ